MLYTRLCRLLAMLFVVLISDSAEIGAVEERKPQGPIPIAQFSEKPIVVQDHVGRLLGFSMRTVDGTQEVVFRVSEDEGHTWSDNEVALRLSPEPGGWGGPEVLVDNEGRTHLFFLNDAHTGVITTGEDRPKRVSGERRLDIWHTKSGSREGEWETPKKIWEGYTGALNSVIQMSNGRILLPFSYRTSRNWGNRGEGLDTFTFRGQFDSTLVYSDDGGDTWHLSPSKLKTPVPDITAAYGAVEPVVLELEDGRVWMLIRTQMGRFYESFSKDGIEWPTPTPSNLICSDSPAGLARLADGCIVLLWNKCLRFPYAYGGRHVLHAAVSEDEGKTWRGHREVARDPLRDEPPPPTGDHGTAYPFPTALVSGKVVFTTGQGEGRVACMLLDPEWLYETRQAADFSSGLDDSCVFGTKGLDLVPHPEKPDSRVLAVRKTHPDWPAAAVWNFPSGAKGELKLRIVARPGFAGARIGLTDHFSVPFDEEDECHNLFNLRLTGGGQPGEGISLTPDSWHEIDLRWNCDEGKCEVLLDGERATTFRQQRTSEGICYLRVVSTAKETDEAGVLIESVEVDVSEAWVNPDRH